MGERAGYVYRAENVAAAALRELLGAVRFGWAWTSGDMYDAGRGDDLLRGDEGRAVRDDVEIRWRRRGEAYDVLVLALSPQRLDGFAPLESEHGWVAQPTRWLRPGRITAGRDHDAGAPATSFLTPGGVVQFVALIGEGGAP